MDGLGERREGKDDDGWMVITEEDTRRASRRPGQDGNSRRAHVGGEGGVGVVALGDVNGCARELPFSLTRARPRRWGGYLEKEYLGNRVRVARQAEFEGVFRGADRRGGDRTGRGRVSPDVLENQQRATATRTATNERATGQDGDRHRQHPIGIAASATRTATTTTTATATTRDSDGQRRRL